LKRPIPSFTVEVRRRPGRTATPSASFVFSETKAPRSEFDRDTDRALAALFGPKSEVAAPAAVPTPFSTGRVLSSLVIDSSLDDGFEDEPSDAAEAPPESEAVEPPAPRRGRGRPRSKPPQGLTPTAEDRPLFAAVEPDEDGEASTEQWLWPVSRVVKTASPKTRVAKTKPAISEDVDIDRSAPAVAASPAPSPNASEVAAEPRKRSIMGRYVHGDEPKPGERWKHKFRNKR
jgi:hypothetical protein